MTEKSIDGVERALEQSPLIDDVQTDADVQHGELAGMIYRVMTREDEEEIKDLVEDLGVTVERSREINEFFGTEIELRLE